MGSAPSVLSMVRVTSARPSGGRPAVPAKMTSSILPPRNTLAPCSPITHDSASTTLDLPEPLGPTTQVMPGSKRSVVAEAKDLKPFNVRLFKCTVRRTLLAAPLLLSHARAGYRCLQECRISPKCRAEQAGDRTRFDHGLVELGGRAGHRDDRPTDAEAHLAWRDHQRPDDDAEIGGSGQREIAQRSGVDPARAPFQAVDDPHGANLGCPRHRAPGKRRPHAIDR